MVDLRKGSPNFRILPATILTQSRCARFTLLIRGSLKKSLFPGESVLLKSVQTFVMMLLLGGMQKWQDAAGQAKISKMCKQVPKKVRSSPLVVFL